MASPGNRLCANCIGTLAFPTKLFRETTVQRRVRPNIGISYNYCTVRLSFVSQFSKIEVMIMMMMMNKLLAKRPRNIT